MRQTEGTDRSEELFVPAGICCCCCCSFRFSVVILLGNDAEPTGKEMGLPPPPGHQRSLVEAGFRCLMQQGIAGTSALLLHFGMHSLTAAAAAAAALSAAV